MRSLQEIGAAVAGAGFIAPVHVEALRRLGVRITGVLGSSPEKSVAAQKTLGLPRAYQRFDELLADREVEAVHVVTPNTLHFEMARQALLAGKHVLCEKPLATDSRQSAELAALARERGLAAGVAYNVRFYPLNLEARDRRERGDLGRIFSVHGSYQQDWLFHDTDYNWRVLTDQGGESRAVADIGTHWIDLVTWITGLEVEAVCADLHTVHQTRRRPRGEVATFAGRAARAEDGEPVKIATEDQGGVLFRFRGGAMGNLHVSQVTAGRKNCIRYEVAGSKCALAWQSEAPNELWIGRRDAPNECLIRDPALVGPRPRAFIDYPGGHNEGYPDTFKQCFRAFYGHIAAGDFSAPPLFPTFDDGHREIVLCEAILRSHREKRWITL
jgi:predicted dehydrogenase